MIWSMEQREYFEFGRRKNRWWEDEKVGAAFSRDVSRSGHDSTELAEVSADQKRLTRWALLKICADKHRQKNT